MLLYPDFKAPFDLTTDLKSWHRGSSLSKRLSDNNDLEDSK